MGIGTDGSYPYLRQCLAFNFSVEQNKFKCPWRDDNKPVQLILNILGKYN